MATKAKTTKTSTKAPVKAAPTAAKKKAKGPTVKVRHPRARVVENHSSKEALAKSLAAMVARPDEDSDQVETRLKRASNAQLLRLSRATATVKQKWGNRDKLIEAIGTAEKKSKDKDFIAKLGTFSLPQLLDLAASADKRARASK